MDNKILSEIKKHPDLKIISFDIFDTLIFRTVRLPNSVFKIMYDSHPEKFPEYTNADDWKNVRQEAEMETRRIKFEAAENYEVKLEDIYNNIPFVYSNKEELIQLELECEKKVCFLNKEIYELIIYLKNTLGFKIILTSDMYLTKEQISNILVFEGFDLNLADEIYISCEYDASKRLHTLYEYILKEHNIKAEEMFHIGDNYYSDVCVPRYLKIISYHFKLISEATYRYPFLELEELAYGCNICEEIFSLRLIAASRNDNFWFRIGTMIMGPFLTYGAEWIVEQAEKNNIKNIRPLMREGKFLTELIKRVVQNKNSNISVEPLYVSRLAVLTALFENITDKEIINLFSLNDITLFSVLKLLKIEDLCSKYKLYWNRKTIDLQFVSNGEISIYTELINYLTSEKTIAIIRKRNEGASKKFEEYLMQTGMTSECITVDIGWRGNVQNAVSSLLSAKGYENKIIHLLYVSKPETAINLTNKCDIRGFAGNFGSFSEITQNIFARFYELFLMCEEGTTIGYEYKDNKIVPELKYIDYPQWQKDAVKNLQEGVKTFQECYYDLVEKKPHISKCKDMNISTLYIMERLCCYPLKLEADNLKNLLYDQNYGSNTLVPIINDKTLNKFLSMDAETYHSTIHEASVIWKSGLNVLKDKFFYYKLYYYLERRYANLSILFTIQKALDKAEKENKKLVLVGAGENLFKYLGIILSAGAADKIEAIIDNNKIKQGNEIFGFKVYPVETHFNTNLYLSIIVNKAFHDSLCSKIKKFTNNEAEFIGYYDNV